MPFSFINTVASWMLKKRMHQIELFVKYPIDVQNEELKKLVQQAKNTEFGKKYDLIEEEGRVISQQYPTSIGKIDILAKDKKTKSYVVIELKKNQTSDDTIGQLSRYMGWIKEHKKDDNVKGIIVAGKFDEKLKYAKTMVPNSEAFLYEVNFQIKEYK